MDETRFAAAEAAYAEGDWRTAAREYLGAAGGGGEGTGEAFHKAGNALMRIKRYDDAVQVYGRALEDVAYGNRGSLSANLGAACLSAGDRARSIDAYKSALEDAEYEARYRALQGLGGALFDEGRIEEAADAYRRAALDDANPQPGKALNNLGLCFGALGRPADAVEAYRAAVALEEYTGRGRASANLGLAYMALGMTEDAARAFSRASGEFGYELTGGAAAAYEAAQAALGDREVVDGWSTGEMAPVFTSKPLEETEELETAFFTRTDDEMKVADREVRRAERVDRRSKKSVWVTVGVWVAVATVAVGAVAFAWLSGLGYPTQEMAVRGLLEAHRAGEAVESYWVAVPSADVTKEMSNLPPGFSTYSLDGTVRSAKTSTVDVTIVLDKGAPLNYKVSLLREGVGWKVNGVTNDWRSTGGGS
ncbi:MAG: tetratricopeptide repeat protein [Actinomycetota bacterium]|nr:tetratricopeptide repeat protein [Actinomycetota bacterium]MDP3630944.1 tetratricopeptide repeat protein [Actinomycetota bacterium]